MYTNEVLSTKTVSELRSIAKEMDLSGYSKAKKDDIILMILDNQSCVEVADVIEETTDIIPDTINRMMLPQNRAQRRKFQAQMRKKIVNKHKKSYGSL